jgi:hypothetical protein
MYVTATVEPGNPDRFGPGTWHVKPVWQVPVDRRYVGGFVLSNKRTAERLAAAINAQAVYVDPQVRVDREGETYVHATSLVLAKRANADLKRLGF